MKILKPIPAIFLVSIILTSCSSTRVLATWKENEEKKYSFSKIAILGIAHDAATRKVFEVAMEESMLADGYAAEGALDFLPPNATEDNISPEIVMAVFKSAKVDAVMSLSILEVDDSRRYVPGVIYYTPYYYTYSFYDHYLEYYDFVYVPGFYAGEVDVFMEASLFDFNSGKLIWSAQTETMDLNTISEIAASFSDILVDDLRKSDILIPTSD
jgi:hypothetical protein